MHLEQAMQSNRDNFASSSPAYWFAGFCIGLTFAGFFDGILLHQILQWHSLLSSLDGEIYQDLRFRMLTDGVFHAVMYGIGVIGLWMLWRSRVQFGSSGSGRRFASPLLIGFGTWHLVDAVLNHWILGLHHIRENAANWLMWDLAFFALGVICAGAGLYLRRKGGTGGGPGLTGVAASTVTGLVIATGVVAAIPWGNNRAVAIVFSEGTSPAQAVTAIDNANGRILWINPEGNVWAVMLGDSGNVWNFYRHGALFVSGSFLGMGCFSAAPVPTE
jgi:uncharacterized membrane protein